MGLALVAFAAAALVLLALGRRVDAGRRATEAELLSARTIAAARLRIYDEDRQERFRRYHDAWSSRRTSALRPVLPFRYSREAVNR